MENLNDIKHRFVKAKRDVETYIFIEDYAKAKEAIEEAVKILNIINKKEPHKWDDIFKELQKQYSICKQKLGEKAKVTSNQNPPKKNPTTVQNGKEGGQDEILEYEDGEDVQTKFGGVEVTSFFDRITEHPSFDDVVGMEKEKEIIRKNFLISEAKQKQRMDMGIKDESFILLYGLPGTGKTFFANAVATEMERSTGRKVKFISVVSTRLKDSKVGQTEKNINAIFDYCQQFEKVIFFLDEIENLLKSRQYATNEPGHDGVVATFLQRIGGISATQKVLLIGATNYPYRLDSAALSRCSTRLEVPLPNKGLIKTVLERKVQRFLTKDVSVEKLAEQLEKKHYSNRDISILINDWKQQAVSVLKEEESYENARITKEMVEEGLKDHPAVYSEKEAKALKDYRKENAY